MGPAPETALDTLVTVRPVRGRGRQLDAHRVGAEQRAGGSRGRQAAAGRGWDSSQPCPGASSGGACGRSRACCPTQGWHRAQPPAPHARGRGRRASGHQGGALGRGSRAACSRRQAEAAGPQSSAVRPAVIVVAGAEQDTGAGPAAGQPRPAADGGQQGVSSAAAILPPPAAGLLRPTRPVGPQGARAQGPWCGRWRCWRSRCSPWQRRQARPGPGPLCPCSHRGSQLQLQRPGHPHQPQRPQDPWQPSSRGARQPAGRSRARQQRCQGVWQPARRRAGYHRQAGGLHPGAPSLPGEPLLLWRTLTPAAGTRAPEQGEHCGTSPGEACCAAGRRLLACTYAPLPPAAMCWPCQAPAPASACSSIARWSLTACMPVPSACSPELTPAPVAEDGLQFESTVRKREASNPRFGFMLPWHEHHPYYRCASREHEKRRCWTLRRLVK